MPDFEVYKAKASKPQQAQPVVAIQRKGALAINGAAFEALGSPEAVELLYARKERIIGIRAADPEQAHAYPTRKPKGGLARLVSAAGFLKHYGIGVDRLMHYPATMVDGILSVDLDHPEEEVTPRAEGHDAQLVGTR